MYKINYAVGKFNAVKPFVIKRDKNARKVIIVDAKRLNMDSAAAVIKY